MTDRKPEEEQQLQAKQAHSQADENQLEMKIPARAEWVRVVRLATAGVASRVGFAYDDIEDIKLAVAEACNNAILHSSSETAGSSSTPVVTILWQLLENGVQISVSDGGRLESLGTASSAQRAGASPENLPEGGMGLLLIESLMDEVRHEFGPHADTSIHMAKYVRAGEPGGPAKPDSAVQSRSSKTVDPDAPVSLRARSLKGTEAASRNVTRPSR